MLKPDPLYIPIRFRGIDFIIFGLIACLLFWEAIQYSELSDLRATVETMEAAQSK